MKDNIEYYQHYSNSDQHPKFKMLRSEFGWSGEGKFWALNNRIAQANGCCLDVSKKYNKASIADDLDMSLIEFDNFISFLLNECELVKECEPGVITTKIVQSVFERVSLDRQKARERSRRRWEKTRVTSGEKDKSSGEDRSKVKDSKVKETKYIPQEVYDFAEAFVNHIEKLKGNKAPKGKNLIKSSADTVDKLIRLDEFTLKQIKDATRWGLKDEFWGNQVLSLASLRKKNDGLTKFQKLFNAYERDTRKDTWDF